MSEPVVTPAVYDGVVIHARTQPLTNRFRYRVRLWLVDLDELPRLPAWLRWAARFEAGDHVGDASKTLRENIAAVFDRGGVDVSDCRLLMLANARTAGYVFNPISVHWAVGSDGAVRGVVAEVHNTYGGRQAYLLQSADHDGGDVVDPFVTKQLYVSPFYGVDGHYSIRVSPPENRISIGVTLHPDAAAAPFVATLQVRRSERGLRGAAMAAAPSALRTAARIRLQGIKLWARGLPIRSRPDGHDQDLSAAERQYDRPAADKSMETVS